MNRILANALSLTRGFASAFSNPPVKTLLPKGPLDQFISPAVQNAWQFNIIRENHYIFKLKESIRVKRLSFYVKVKTRKGRKQIMRRILKGRYVITH